MVPCEPDMISIIATEVMLLSMGYFSVWPLLHYPDNLAPQQFTRYMKTCPDYSIVD